MPQCQFPIFCYFCVSKSYIWNILGIGRNKSRSSYFPRYETESKAETEGGQRVAAPCHSAGHPCPRQAMVWASGPPPNIALPPIYSPRRENPKGPNSFPENILQAAAIVDARSGGSRSSSRYRAREGNHHQRLMTHKYRGSQQSLREVKPTFIDLTQGEPKNIYKPWQMSCQFSCTWI
jgi:hypothetical protein